MKPNKGILDMNEINILEGFVRWTETKDHSNVFLEEYFKVATMWYETHKKDNKGSSFTISMINQIMMKVEDDVDVDVDGTKSIAQPTNAIKCSSSNSVEKQFKNCSLYFLKK